VVSELIELRAPKMSFRYFDKIEMQPQLSVISYQLSVKLY